MKLFGFLMLVALGFAACCKPAPESPVKPEGAKMEESKKEAPKMEESKAKAEAEAEAEAEAPKMGLKASGSPLKEEAKKEDKEAKKAKKEEKKCRDAKGKFKKCEAEKPPKK